MNECLCYYLDWALAGKSNGACCARMKHPTNTGNGGFGFYNSSPTGQYILPTGARGCHKIAAECRHIYICAHWNVGEYMKTKLAAVNGDSTALLTFSSAVIGPVTRFELWSFHLINVPPRSSLISLIVIFSRGKPTRSSASHQSKSSFRTFRSCLFLTPISYCPL